MVWLDSIVSSVYFPYIFTILLVLPFIVLLRQFVFSYIKMKNQELKMLTVKGNSGNKSQAYERLTLFLERIKPTSLVKRFDDSLQKEEFIFLCTKAIQEEFEYNASQQLYTTPKAWQEVLDAKNYVMQLLQDAGKGLSKEASLEEFKTVFLLQYVQDEEPIIQSIDYLRKEIILIT